MRDQKEKRKNEKGSISLLLTAFVLSLSLFLVYKITLPNSSLNALHSSSREDFKVRQNINSLASALKDAYILGLFNPNCSEKIKKENFIRKTIEKKTTKEKRTYTLCIPKRGLCTKVIDAKGHDILQCASASIDNLKLENIPGTPGVEKFKAGVFKKEFSEKFNRILIPDQSNKNIWRSCGEINDLCVRLVLCAPGKKSCEWSDAVASQVVKLGVL